MRMGGKTYPEILALLNKRVSKSTLTYWFKNISLSTAAQSRIMERRQLSLENARNKSLAIRGALRKKYLEGLRSRNMKLKHLLKDKNIAKVVLITLFVGEGSKNPKRGSLVFGNADPKVIALFLRLLDICYKIDKTKFRCTVQCRADQNIKTLETFWSSVTAIPKTQFYKSRIDKRTVGKISRKQDYKGVCRLDYFSAYILNDLLKGMEVLVEGR